MHTRAAISGRNTVERVRGRQGGAGGFPAGIWKRALAGAGLAAALVAGGLPFGSFLHTVHAAPSASPTFTKYPTGGVNAHPRYITTGPDGNEYFTEDYDNKIGKLTPSGTLTETALPTASTSPKGITTGPDGNIWFTEHDTYKIGKLDLTTSTISEYPVTTASSGPWGIVTGFDGNLWFTENGASQVGVMTAAGAMVTEYSAGNYPQDLIEGPDHKVWFNDYNQVGSVNTSGTVTLYPTACGSCEESGLVAGPDGKIYFDGNDNNSSQAYIGHINTDGTGLTLQVVGHYVSNWTSTPAGMTVLGSAIYFADGNGYLSQLAPASGSISQWAIPNSSSPYAIAVGADHASLYITDFTNGASAVHKAALPGTCNNLLVTPQYPATGPGMSTSVTVSLMNCGTTSSITGATTTTTTTPPTGCPAAPPISPFNSTLAPGDSNQTVASFAAPSCQGTYTVNSQTTVGSTVINTASGTYVSQVGAIIDFGPIPNNCCGRPVGMTSGPDGNLWFSNGPNIYKLTTAGVMTPYATPISNASILISGPDGNLWVADGQGVDRVIPATGAKNAAFFPPSGVYISGLATGSDGNLWFDGSYGSSSVVGKITGHGDITEYALPDGTSPGRMIGGADGNLWFAGSGVVGKLATSGAYTLYPDADFGYVTGVTLGPDGNVWFSLYPSEVVRVQPNGNLTPFTTPNSIAYGISTGSDGNLWFAESGHTDQVVRVTPTGTFTEYPGISGSNVQGTAAGPDGNLWMDEYYGIRIAVAGLGTLGSCNPAAVSPSSGTSVAGATENVAATVNNCASASNFLTVTTTATPPAGCGGSPLVQTQHVEMAPHTKTVVPDNVKPTCVGTWSASTTLSQGSTTLGTASTSFTVVAAAPVDMDGDNFTDQTVFRPSTGTWWALNSTTSPPYTATGWGVSGDIPVPADYLGQGHAQTAVYRPSTGTWYITGDGGATYGATQWGAAGDIPVPGDYDGTGRAQIAVYRPSTGVCYVLHAGGTYSALSVGGNAGDIPVPADYEGAGHLDAAVFRPSTGQWLIRHGDGTQVTATWGVNGDVPLPGLYEGGGQADIAVYRPSTGVWFVLHHNGTYVASTWGTSSDIPVPGDFDGDGKLDIAVYRPSTGVWYALPSSGGSYTATVWGAAGDKPVVTPAAIRMAFYP